MSSPTDRIREAIERVLWLQTHRFSTDSDPVARDKVIEAARSFVEGELPPGFPTEADVETAAKAMLGPYRWEHAGPRKLWVEIARAGLVAVAESRRLAAASESVEVGDTQKEDG